MVTKFQPESNKVYLIKQHTMIHVLEGTGGIQVDFKNFNDWDDKLIFLEKGQYIKFLTGGFVVRQVEFEEDEIFKEKDFRVLFKHLVSLGYINFTDCLDCQKYLASAIFSKPQQILDISSNQWFWQNPFNATKEEYHLIFDVKELIDNQFKQHLSNNDLLSYLGNYELNPQLVYTEKVGITIKRMMGVKRLIESQKELAFTTKSIKEISYDFGYKDPTYFNRVFKGKTGMTPNQFREQLTLTEEDPFVNNLYELLQRFHTEQRKVGFYAEELNLSVKTLSRKVKERLQLSIGQLIRQEVLKTAKKQLTNQMPIHEIAQLLNFEENNHFSAFFKHYTGMSPTEYQNLKMP